MERISSLIRPRNSHVELAHKVDYTALHLSFKQRMQIVSRRDRMGRTKPGWMRVLAAALVVFILVVVGGKLQTRALDKKAPTGAPVKENEIQLSFAGDIMLGRYVETFGSEVSYDELFRPSKALWAESDLVFANLECSVFQNPDQYLEADKLTLPAKPEALSATASAGISALSLANNHTVDFGRDALSETLSLLQANGIRYAGAGENWEEAGSCCDLTADGINVGFLACTQIVPSHFTANKDGAGVATPKSNYFNQSVTLSAMRNDLTVVYVHWGNENSPKISEKQRELAHRLINSGADIIIGSHAHVLQGVEEYEGKNHSGIIFYGLGNYIFDQAQRPYRNTMLVQLNVNKETGEGLFTLIPMHIENFHPFETTNAVYVSEFQRCVTRDLSDQSYRVLDNGRIEIPYTFTIGGQ